MKKYLKPEFTYIKIAEQEVLSNSVPGEDVFNDIIWDNKLNSLPIISKDGKMKYFVFRKDYDSHKQNPNELLDEQKRYVVGAGINTRDYEERVPALLEAGADVLCIDSSEGFSELHGSAASTATA